MAIVTLVRYHTYRTAARTLRLCLHTINILGYTGKHMSMSYRANSHTKADRLATARDTARTLRTTHERSLHWRDLLQTPTAISVAGLALVLRGTRSIDTVQGVHQVAAGRALDLVDGAVARHYQQESDAGALADTVCDKLGMLAITRKAIKDEAIPKAIPIGIFANNLTSAALTTAAGIRHPHESYRPTKTGKLGMALSNLGVLGHLYAHALEAEKPQATTLHRTVRTISTGAAVAGIALSVASNIEYAKRVP